MKGKRLLLVVSCVWASIAVGGAVYEGQIYTQDFTGAEGTVPAGWSVWGTNASSARAELRNNALYIDENAATQNLVGISSPSILPVAPTNGAFLRADYLESTNLTASWIQFAGSYAVKYIGRLSGTNGQQGYWNGGSMLYGGATNVPCRTWTTLTKLYVGRGPDGSGQEGVLNFINKKFNVGFWDNNVDSLSRSLVFVAEKDTTPRTTNDTVSFDNVVAYAPATIDFTNTLLWAPLYSEEFDAPSLGAEWTVQTGTPPVNKCTVIVSQDLSRLEVTVNTNAPANFSWATVWLAFTNAGVLGRSLQVGEYVEVGVTRANGARAGLQFLGRSFRPMQTGFGVDDYLRTYITSNDVFGLPASNNEERVSADTYDWDKPDGEWTRMGMRIDYADGDFAVCSLYIDRKYAASWLFSTAATGLSTLGLFTQGDGAVTSGKAYFGYLKVYAPSSRPLAPLAGYRSDYRTTSFPPRWQYLWNRYGAIGNATNYAPLSWCASANYYSVDGNPTSSTNYVHLKAIGGHPGMGFTQTNAERYAIAAYTVPHEGSYAITESVVQRSVTNASDGVRVRVYVNDTLRQSSVVTVNTTNSFDVALGPLLGNDRIYVAVGSYANWNSDSFSWDFSIAATPPPGTSFLIR